MQLVKHLNSDSLIVDTTGVVKAETYRQMHHTYTVLDAAREQAKAIIADAEAMRDEIFATARLEADADAEAAALTETLARAAQLDAWVEAIKPKLAEAVRLAGAKSGAEHSR